MKKAITLSVAVVILISAITLLSGCNSKTDIWLQDLEVYAEVNTDGSIDVSERWNASIDSFEERKNIYKTIEIKNLTISEFNDFFDTFSVFYTQSGSALRLIKLTEPRIISNTPIMRI